MDGTSVWALSYDSDPSGGSQIGAVIYQSRCSGPAVHVGDAGHDVLYCESWGDSDLICDEGA